MSKNSSYGGGNGGRGGNGGGNGNGGGGGAPSNQQSRYQRQMAGKQGQSSVRIQGQSEKGQGRKENADKAALRIEG
jgi:hypothetical protein